MTAPPTVSARGLSTQRQVDALNVSAKIFTKEAIHRTPIATGITVEYALHSTTSNGANAADATLPEERVLLIMGFLQAKESWGAVIDTLLEKWRVVDGQPKRVTIASFDNRGVGGSDAPWWRYTTDQMASDALALMDHLGWGSAHIAGIR